MYIDANYDRCDKCRRLLGRNDPERLELNFPKEALALDARPEELA